MNESVLIVVVGLAEALLVGLILLALPRVTRRGLLFGAHVGEELSEGPGADRLRRTWRNGVLLLTGAGMALALALGGLGHELAALLAAIGPVGVGSVPLYIGLHRTARELVGTSRAAPLPAPAGADEPASLVLPLTTLAACLLVASLGLVDAALHWAELPARIPVHFGADGRPDGWVSKSFASVFAIPITSFAMSLMIAGMAALVARARLSLRSGGSSEQLAAQRQFRSATVTMLCGTAVLCAGLFAALSWDSLRTALGEREGLGPGVPVLGIALVVFCLGYALRLIWHHGQGGSRREGAAGEPLTDGLGDESHWKWGLFYINREDPSVLVEKRFGVGYTVNLGNRWGVRVLVVIFALLGAVALLAIWGASR